MEKRPTLPKSGIVVDYYQGAYGPTIIIDTMTDQELRTIRDVFVDLARGSIDFLNLVGVSGLTAMGIDALILRRQASSEVAGKCLVRNKNKSGRVEFHWTLPPDEWWARVNLVDGFAEGAGHHYLTDEDNDAIIVLQFKESAALRGLN